MDSSAWPVANCTTQLPIHDTTTYDRLRPLDRHAARRATIRHHLHTPNQINRALGAVVHRGSSQDVFAVRESSEHTHEALDSPYQ
jgi:hypothetical protein